MDSVEGIARFWVGEDQKAVAESLRDLEARNLLARRTIAGTDFYSLPEAAAPHTVTVPESEGGKRERGRILVVDDDPTVCELLERFLSDRGHLVESAARAEQALEQLNRSRFDLVVTDIKMPGMSGLELLAMAKRLDPVLEVVVVTAHATLETAIQALRRGAYDLITKPIPELETLYRAVERALEKRRLSIENRLLVQNLSTRNAELKETVSRLATVNEIGKATTGLMDLEETYSGLVQLVAQELNARRVSLFVEEPDTQTLTLAGAVGMTEGEPVRRPIRVGEGLAGRVAASQTPLLVQDIDKTDLKHLRAGGRYATTSFMISPLMLSYPIRYKHSRIGVINVADKQSGEPFTEKDLEFLSILTSQMAVAIENAHLVREMSGGYQRALAGLIEALEDLSQETRGHTARVVALATAIGKTLRLDPIRLKQLRQAATLHEIGRASARRARDDERGRASVSVWTSADALASERVLAPIASLRAVREIILRSADLFDRNEASLPTVQVGMPVEALILAVCETYDRLAAGAGPSSKRGQTALKGVREIIGTEDEAALVEAMYEALDKMEG
jgi:CheY-like chemotaxis protein/GAF domain-containing protein